MNMILQNISNKARIVGVETKAVCKSAISITTNYDINNPRTLYTINRDNKTKKEYNYATLKYIGEIDNTDFIILTQIEIDRMNGMMYCKYRSILINGYGETLVQDIMSCKLVNGVLIIIRSEDNKRFISVRKPNMKLITQEYKQTYNLVSRSFNSLRETIEDKKPHVNKTKIEMWVEDIIKECRSKMSNYVKNKQRIEILASESILNTCIIIIYIESINNKEQLGPFLIDEKGNLYCLGNK